MSDQPPPPPPSRSGKPAGWYKDPSGRYDWRYFDGRWTEGVANEGDDATYTDPVPPAGPATPVAGSSAAPPPPSQTGTLKRLLSWPAWRRKLWKLPLWGWTALGLIGIVGVAAGGGGASKQTSGATTTTITTGDRGELTLHGRSSSTATTATTVTATTATAVAATTTVSSPATTATTLPPATAAPVALEAVTAAVAAFDLSGDVTCNVGTTLQLGDSGDDVRCLQTRLDQITPGTDIVVDGTFGSDTDNLIRQFQTVNALTVDGVVGPETAGKLGIWDPVPAAQPLIGQGCEPAYPDFCVPPAPPDLDCGDIPGRRFTVLAPDPHGFDGDGNGVGCQWN